MDTSLSLGEALGRLETRIADLRAQEAEHAEREAFHRERRTAITAELEQLTPRLEAVRGLADVSLPAPPKPPPEPPTPAKEEAVPKMADLRRGGRVPLARLVAEVVKRKGPQERFGARSVAAEVRRLFGDEALASGPLSLPRISSALRWLIRKRAIVVVSKGRPHQEAQYAPRRPSSQPTAGS
jgi:hypothetical protein